MAQIEYIAPYARVTIGPWSVNKIAEINVYSSRINPLDIAEISIPAENVSLDAITKGMSVDIAQGYREKGLWPIFSGKVMDVSWGRLVSIYCKDSMEQLRTTTISKTFVNASPQEIVKYALGQAGITDFRLSAKELPKRHCFVASGLNVIQLIKLVTRAWNLDDWAFYFEPEGDFYWGPWEESARYQAGQIMVFEYGQNIIDLKPSDNGLGELKTIALPFIRHSHIIKIRDRRFWEREVTARVERVTYTHGKYTGMVMEWQIKQN